LSAADVEALLVMLEQLQATELELRQQNHELALARDALEAERHRFRELFDLAPDPCLLSHLDGRVTEANQAACSLLRVQRRFLLGKPLQVFVPASERTAFRARLADMGADGARQEWRMRLVPRARPAVPVVVAVAAGLDARGELAGLRWALRDISALVRDEDRLRDLNAELERRVAVRTAELQAANLAKDELLERERAARDVAEDANRSKDAFLATLSHELRTPLNVVLGWASRLRGHTVDAASVDRAFAAIERNARQQLRLVEDLLDSARIASGQFQLELAPHELAPLLKSAVDSLESVAAAKRITVTCALEEGAIVQADPERMRQIAGNLVSNALKFTPERGAVHVALDAGSGRAEFQVSDTGIGIPPAALPHLFERFWQVEPSTRRSAGGLGLGLAIVKHLVELHGGEVFAASRGPGAGSIFTVRLPLTGSEVLNDAVVAVAKEH
jgi:PAS domain S-box-containing protein